LSLDCFDVAGIAFFNHHAKILAKDHKITRSQTTSSQHLASANLVSRMICRSPQLPQLPEYQDITANARWAAATRVRSHAAANQSVTGSETHK